jgi:hypothetical protein
MTWIYLLESIPKNKIKTSPLFFPIFYGYRTDNSHDSHCALAEEEEGGSVSSCLYRDTVAMGTVTSARPLLLMQ